jgi:hypothetical protein
VNEPTLTSPEVAAGPEADEPTIDLSSCVAPEGVSAAPRTIEEAVVLMNALPKPTSVACLVASLERPLDVYLTRSRLSAQPAFDERNPRTFLVLAPLFVSIVPAGPSSSLVEMGYRTSTDRSVKAELAFPLTRAITAADLLERVQIGRVSVCAGCHTAEQRVTSGIFAGTEGGFESGVIPPFFFYEVSLEAFRAERAACDASAEPARCEMLSALFDHGEIRASTVWASSDGSESSAGP